MSALSSGSGVAARLAPAKPKTHGFLHIVRHGAGPHAIYIVTYHRLDHDGTPVIGHDVNGVGSRAMPDDVQKPVRLGFCRGEPCCYS